MVVYPVTSWHMARLLVGSPGITGEECTAYHQPGKRSIFKTQTMISNERVLLLTTIKSNSNRCKMGPSVVLNSLLSSSLEMFTIGDFNKILLMSFLTEGIKIFTFQFNISKGDFIDLVYLLTDCGKQIATVNTLRQLLCPLSLNLS